MTVAMQETEQKLHHSSPEAHPGLHCPRPAEGQLVGELAGFPYFSNVNCTQGHSSHRPVPAICSFRRSFRRFLARPEKALLAGTPFPPPAAGNCAASANKSSVLSALNLTSSSHPPAPTLFSAPFAHISKKHVITPNLNRI